MHGSVPLFKDGLLQKTVPNLPIESFPEAVKKSVLEFSLRTHSCGRKEVTAVVRC